MLKAVPPLIMPPAPPPPNSVMPKSVPEGSSSKLPNGCAPSAAQGSPSAQKLCSRVYVLSCNSKTTPQPLPTLQVPPFGVAPNSSPLGPSVTPARGDAPSAQFAWLQKL